LSRPGGVRTRSAKTLSKTDLKTKVSRCKERLFYLALPKLYACLMSNRNVLEKKSASTVVTKLKNKFSGADPIDIIIINLLLLILI
jgi:hypothetical protein